MVEIFFNNGKILKSGDLLVQKDLAHTLELIAQKGQLVFIKAWQLKLD